MDMKSSLFGPPSFRTARCLIAVKD
jgi:hypothetical protein